MSTADLVAVAGFAAMFLMMLVRVPIGVAMALTGVGGFAAIAGWGPALNLLATSPVRTATDYNFSLIPMFILMGVLATASGMSKELFRAGYAWLGHFRGGLALATIGACGGFAAICGSSVATAATMSNIALPEMRRFGYRDDIATGVIAAGGTLGILIPPSVVLAIYGFITEQDVGPAVHRRHPPGAARGGHVHGYGAPRLWPQPACGRGDRVDRASGLVARRLGGRCCCSSRSSAASISGS